MTALGPSEIPDGPVTSAANTLIQAGVLGALVVILLAIAILVVIKWNKTNELRVEYQKKMADTVRDMAKDNATLVTSVTEALGELVGTTDALKEAMKANTEASKTMERTINETVREAIRAGGYRRYASPPGGTPPAVPPGSSSPSGGSR